MAAVTRSIPCVFAPIFLLFFFGLVYTVSGQVRDPPPPDIRTPTGALWRAAAVPGWGQAYNGQYLKLPFIYGAMGGLLYAAIKIDNDYKLYRRAFLYKAFQEQLDSGLIELNPFENNRPSYDELAAKFGQISSSPIRAQRDTLRRNRDLSYLGVGLVYALSILDAYVSAHLLDFNVDENLAFRIDPSPNGIRLSGRIVLP